MTNRTEPHLVYRCYDGDGELMYVGCTVDLKVRASVHVGRSPWWSDVNRIETETFPSKQEALVAERVLIEQHQPPRNIRYTARDPWNRSRLRAALVGAAS